MTNRVPICRTIGFRSPVGVILRLCFVGVAIGCRSFGHEVNVHEAITEKAAQVSPELLAFLEDQLGRENAPFTQAPVIPTDISDTGVGVFVKSPVGWMIAGSRTEDSDPRYKNHFFDPTKAPAAGLTDRLDLYGIPSFTWASVRGGGGSVGAFYNSDTWQNARDYQLSGLNSGSKIARWEKIALMLYALGRVIHLNQDLSQPDHVRNDNHTTIPVVGGNPFGPAWIENYGKDNLEKKKANWLTLPPENRRGWAYWRGIGFRSLEDFWDRNLYTGNSLALKNDADEKPGWKLGLAEFVNGNFLGEDAVYAEYFSSGNRHYFPFPSLRSSTTFPAWKQAWGQYLRVSYLKNGTPITRGILRKTADGITVEQHSVLLHLGIQGGGRGSGPGYLKVASSINETAVLDEYHRILIPKAIEYSAGILDYFFRGRLDVYISLGNTPGKYSLSIKNVSGQSLQGGSFKLYYDNASAVRAEITAPSFTTTYGTSLPDNGTITGEFNAPSGEVSSYMLVYKGTIGVDGSSAAIDTVDADIAIAAKRFVTCTPPSGTPTASSLAYDDAADLGTIHLDRSSPKTAFGSYPLGVYRVQYVGDTYRCHIDPDYPGTLYQPNQPVWGTAWAGTQPPLAGTKAYYFSSSGEIETPFLPGFYDCVDQNAVVTYTLNQNQNITPFTHQSGAISLAPDADGDICSNWEIPDPGGPEYKLQRLKSFFPQPARVRIKDYATLIKPLIPGCSACPTVTGVAEWDGSFTERTSLGQGSAQWETPAVPLAINGRQINIAQVRYANVPPDLFGNAQGWALEIYCTPPGLGSTLLWRGIKVIGNDPVGTYFNENRGTGLPMCADQPCCLTVESY